MTSICLAIYNALALMNYKPRLLAKQPAFILVRVTFHTSIGEPGETCSFFPQADQKKVVPRSLGA